VIPPKASLALRRAPGHTPGARLEGRTTALQPNGAGGGYLPWTLPPQPRSPRQPVGLRIGKIAAIAGFAALAGVVALRLAERRRPPSETPAGEEPAAARDLATGAAILALSVLADSAIEHYRGAYHNPAMYIAPSVAAVSLANSLHMAVTPQEANAGRLALSGMTLATGLTGFAFHLYNVVKRDGGLRLVNLFYGAPIAAPAAIAICGIAKLAAVQLVAEAEEGAPPTLLGRPAGSVIAIGTAVSLLGTTAEAALLHLRGAFHDPFMFVPVTVPPAAAAMLAASVWQRPWRGAARVLLRLTAGAGIVGVGFHIYGVSRNMGGFYNWSQNVLNGPPIPAPPSFTGVALAGLAALRLMEAA